MVKPSFEAAKGTKDWYGSETIIRNSIRDKLKTIFERYGYDRLETPMIERRDAMAFKGGGEIQKEVFLLQDQGSRELALRFDQTVPLARFIASYPEIKFPFKRYAMGEVFRDGPTQPEQGRYRSFTQCDVDVLGIKDMSAEAELFALAQDAFKELGLGDVEVNINNRKLLDGILDYAGVNPQARLRTITTLDKLDKIGVEGLTNELLTLRFSDKEHTVTTDTLQKIIFNYDYPGQDVILDQNISAKLISEVGERGYNKIKELVDSKDLSRAQIISEIANYSDSGDLLLSGDSVNKILEIVRIEGDNDGLYKRLEQLVTSPKGIEGLKEVGQLLSYSRSMGFDSVKLNPSLARGLDYYTGTTIEVFLKDRKIVPSAILAGGRFDDMIGDFRGSQEEIPAVGFSFGLERLAMIIGAQKEVAKTVRQLYILPIGDTQGECLRVAHELRNQGLNVDMNLQRKSKVGKAVEYADKSGIPYVGFIGETEIQNSTVRIKNLKTGEQKDVAISDVGSYIGKA
jgi:histidyl-tRNA synthetase